jgi:hypothetical protein
LVNITFIEEYFLSKFISENNKLHKSFILSHITRSVISKCFTVGIVREIAQLLISNFWYISGVIYVVSDKKVILILEKFQDNILR